MSHMTPASQLPAKESCTVKGRRIAYVDECEGVSWVLRAGRMFRFKSPAGQRVGKWHADPERQALSEHRRAGIKLAIPTLVHGMAPWMGEQP
ncbi:MAG: hypothetical protein EPN69_02435 [Rhodanobacter sp.]|nr:MAG: hypothetical protein EPN69_02435 [Rhodanobacter sp.]TAM38652.1 MAG: hypothetical protein EPN58_16295 [Rhodanobacter sp.]TAN23677.1 MAG: hypothetical protein EPN32_10870 [Rhodanobacter sp.]